MYKVKHTIVSTLHLFAPLVGLTKNYAQISGMTSQCAVSLSSIEGQGHSSRLNIVWLLGVRSINDGRLVTF